MHSGYNIIQDRLGFRDNMLLRNVPICCSLMLILSPLLAPVSTQFALSEERLRDDSICGAASECVIISQCPSVLKLVFKVSKTLQL